MRDGAVFVEVQGSTGKRRWGGDDSAGLDD
jgi:hypothetical protein